MILWLQNSHAPPIPAGAIVLAQRTSEAKEQQMATSTITKEQLDELERVIVVYLLVVAD